jgi:hypothetical protein
MSTGVGNQKGQSMGNNDFQMRGPFSSRGRQMHQILQGGRRKDGTGVEWMSDSLADYDRVTFDLMLHRDHGRDGARIRVLVSRHGSEGNRVDTSIKVT